MAGVYEGQGSHSHSQTQATTHLRVENGTHVTNIYQTTVFNNCSLRAIQMSFQLQQQPPIPQTAGMYARLEPQPGFVQPAYLNQPYPAAQAPPQLNDGERPPKRPRTSTRKDAEINVLRQALVAHQAREASDRGKNERSAELFSL